MSAAWADPPPIGGPQDPRAVWMERLRPLMAEPGRWAIIKSGLPSTCQQTATALRNRQWNVPPGGWEFTVRTFRRGVHVGDMNAAQLYARYLGPEDNAPIGVSPDRELDGEGYRICEDCKERLPHPGVGKWPKKCDDCWKASDPKWFRRRERLRRDRAAQREAGTWVSERHRPGYKLFVVDWNSIDEQGRVFAVRTRRDVGKGEVVTVTTIDRDVQSLATVEMVTDDALLFRLEEGTAS